MESDHRKECRRYNTPGDAHHLTFSCFQRQPFLSRDRSRRWFIDGFGRAREKHAFSIWAWVIMPEHVHVLIHPHHAGYSIAGILKSTKLPVTSAALKYVREKTPAFLARMRDEQPNGKVNYRFWQRGGGYDTNLWTPAHIAATISYIHNNPVRRGLAASATDWEWSSARDYARMREPLLPLNLASRPWT